VPTTHPVAQTAEIVGVDRFRLHGRGSVKQEPPQNETVLISTYQFPDILAARAIASPGDLLIDEALKMVR
jgi:hypothetical protein